MTSANNDQGEPSSADRNEYVLTKDWTGEQERLHLIETTADPVSVAAIRAAGFGPGSRCLDIGAGSGSIAKWFAQETGDPSLVVATDVDTRLLVPLEGEGVRVLKHDVLVDDFPPGSFDVIHARTVLEHLVAREDVIARVADWLTPQGIFVLVDAATFPFSTSSNALYRAAMRACFGAMELAGSDYEWARTFPEPLQRHGYRDIGASVKLMTLQGGSAVARLLSMTLETLRTRIVDAGLLANDAIDDTQRLLADPEFWDLGHALLAAWGRKPA